MTGSIDLTIARCYTGEIKARAQLKIFALRKGERIKIDSTKGLLQLGISNKDLEFIGGDSSFYFLVISGSSLFTGNLTATTSPLDCQRRWRRIEI